MPDHSKQRRGRAFGASGSFAISVAIALATLGVAPLSRANSTPNSTFSATQPASRSFNVSYLINVVPPASSEKERVWVPLPSTDQFQTISQLQLKAPSSIHVHKDSRYGNRYAFFTVDPSRVKAPFGIRLTFHVVRYEHQAELIQAAALSDRFPKDVAPFLQPDRLIPVDGVVAKVAREQTQDLTDPVQKARRIYEYILSTMSYNRTVPGGGRGDAGWACDAHQGNCADFHSLFIGMARAVGIPARFQIGFLLPKEEKGGTVLDYHSWAEFYVNGAGWIPVDVSEASQQPDKHDYFFGTIDADRVTISIGRDVPLTPEPKAGPLNYIVYPYIEVDGKPYANYSTDVFFHDTGIPGLPLGKKQIVANNRISNGRQPHFPS
jgi:transglutaminase-like putative cysteine protease